MSDDSSVLQYQIDYYRARAAEYDDFWLRRGDYRIEDPQRRQQWREDTDEAEHFAVDWGPFQSMLELASGTGLWTRHLVGRASVVVSVDAAPEMIEQNKARLRTERPLDASRVSHEVADLFTWSPPLAAFDGVFFGYWLSHVPDELLAGFFDKVATALRPRGMVRFVDSATGPGKSADAAARRETRTLADGSTHTVVKRLWSPSDLGHLLAELGWDASVQTTRHGHILMGTARAANLE